MTALPPDKQQQQRKRVLLLGPRNSGKTWLRKIVFSGRQELDQFLSFERKETELKIVPVDVDGLLNVEIWDVPGEEIRMEESDWALTAAIIYVLDAQEDLRLSSLREMKALFTRANLANKSIDLNVFVNKVDGDPFSSEESRVEVQYAFQRLIAQEFDDQTAAGGGGTASSATATASATGVPASTSTGVVSGSSFGGNNNNNNNLMAPPVMLSSPPIPVGSGGTTPASATHLHHHHQMLFPHSTAGTGPTATTTTTTTSGTGSTPHRFGTGGLAPPLLAPPPPPILDVRDITLHLTSVYSQSVFEAFALVMQRLMRRHAYVVTMLDSLIEACDMEKAFLFDAHTKLNLATDRNPVDPQTQMLCGESIDLVLDFERAYGDDDGNNNNNNNGDGAREGTTPSPTGGGGGGAPSTTTMIVSLSHDMLLYSARFGQRLMLICLLRKEAYTKPWITDHNVARFQNAVLLASSTKPLAPSAQLPNSSTTTEISSVPARRAAAVQVGSAPR